MMMMLGEFETKLDVCMQGIMKESLAYAQLIGNYFEIREAQY